MNTNFVYLSELTTADLNDMVFDALMTNSYLLLSAIIDQDAFEGHELLITHLDHILWERSWKPNGERKLSAGEQLEETFANTNMSVYDVVYAIYKVDFYTAVDMIESGEL